MAIVVIIGLLYIAKWKRGGLVDFNAYLFPCMHGDCAKHTMTIQVSILNDSREFISCSPHSKEEFKQGVSFCRQNHHIDFSYTLSRCHFI